jgi:hypothetical protein
MSPDPVRGSASNPQTWNRYTYVTNNPSGLKDPLGRSFVVLKPPPVTASDWFSLGWGEGGTAIFGNDIFDAIAGMPGTYLSYDMYGNLSFGLSPTLWAQTLNYIDTTAQNNPILSFMIPTNGYVVTLQDFGTGVGTSGLIPDMEALAEERQQLANMAGVGQYYAEYLANFGVSPENPGLQNQYFQNTMYILGVYINGSSPIEGTSFGGYLTMYNNAYQNFLNYENTFLNFAPASQPPMP